MKGNHLAVFAASLQCTDEAKVMSRDTTRSLTLVTWGILWTVSASEQDGERGGRFPSVRHENSLGLIASA